MIVPTAESLAHIYATAYFAERRTGEKENIARRRARSAVRHFCQTTDDLDKNNDDLVDGDVLDPDGNPDA